MSKRKWKRARGAYGSEDEYATFSRGKCLAGLIYREDDGWWVSAHELGPHTSLAKAKAAYERVKRASKEPQ